MPPYKGLRSFATLRRIVARLRGPRGCPWDRKQTLDSLKIYLLEEAYELADALDRKAADDVKEELAQIHQKLDLILSVLKRG